MVTNEKYIKKDNYHLYARYFPASSPDAPTVVMINGHTRPGSDFQLFAKHLNECGYSCLVPDNRDAGKSLLIDNTEPQPYDLDDMASDVAALCEALSIRQFHILGISMGGLISQTVAELYAKRTLSLVIISSTDNLEYIRNMENNWPEEFTALKAKISAYFTPEFNKKHDLIIEAMVKGTQKEITSGDFITRAGQQRAAMRRKSNSSDLLDNTTNDTSRTNWHGPTLIVHGTKDLIVPYSHTTGLMTRYKAAQLIAMEGNGHLLIAEKGKELYKCTSLFLDKIST